MVAQCAVVVMMVLAVATSAPASSTPETDAASHRERIEPPPVKEAINGTAMYRERMLLPPGALFEATLEDISRHGAPATVIDRVLIEAPTVPPIEFILRYDPELIDDRNTYSVRGTIVVDGKLYMTTDSVYPVLTQEAGSDVELMLIRVGGGGPSVEAEPIDDESPMRGMFLYMADAAVFTECGSGRKLPVANDGEYIELERAYLEARRRPEEQLLAEIEGTIEQRPPMEGEGTVETVVVDRLIGVWPGETCGARGVIAELKGNRWALVRLNGKSVPGRAAKEPFLFFGEENRVGGSTGCNNITGEYTLEGSSMTFDKMAAGARACVEGMDVEVEFNAAMGMVRSYRLSAQHLELLDEDGHVLARFESRNLI